MNDHIRGTNPGKSPDGPGLGTDVEMIKEIMAKTAKKDQPSPEEIE
jgi:hypothetical protein